jgi:hypothetical protein
MMIDMSVPSNCCQIDRQPSDRSTSENVGTQTELLRAVQCFWL